MLVQKATFYGWKPQRMVGELNTDTQAIYAKAGWWSKRRSKRVVSLTDAGVALSVVKVRVLCCLVRPRRAAVRWVFVERVDGMG